MHAEHWSYYAQVWAEKAWAAGFKDHAIDVLTKALKIYPSDWKCLHLRGHFHSMNKRLDLAEQDLQIALSYGEDRRTKDLLSRVLDARGNRYGDSDTVGGS